MPVVLSRRQPARKAVFSGSCAACKTSEMQNAAIMKTTAARRATKSDSDAKHARGRANHLRGDAMPLCLQRAILLSSSHDRRKGIWSDPIEESGAATAHDMAAESDANKPTTAL